MASLTQPAESGQASAKSPATGTLRFSAEAGVFFRYFPAQTDGNGNILSEAQKVEVKHPKFMLVAVNFFRVTGGRPDPKNRENFLSVSSPLIVTDKGYKWEQLIPVWVGRGNKTPSFLGKWADIKEAVKGQHGKYTEIVFVVCADWPNELLMLEISGEVGNSFRTAQMNSVGKYKSELVSVSHTITMTGLEAYEVSRNTFQKPIFKIEKYGTTSPGYDKMYPLLLDFSRAVDEYGDALALNQKSETNEAAPKSTGAAQRHEPADNSFAGAEPPPSSDFDDLPF